MPTYNVAIYEFDPLGVISQTVGGTTTYSGPATANGSATITDNQTGVDGQYLDDVSTETATADTTIGGNSDTGSQVYAEEAWTLIDSETGKEFQLITFRINAGSNTGWYTLSEIPLVPGRVYETVSYDTNPIASSGEESFSYADYAVSDGIVEGTSGDDTIDASYTGDPGNDVVDGNDAPAAAPPTPSEFNWSDYSDEQDLRAGVTQDTGEITVTTTYTDVQTTEEFSAETSGGTNDGVYVAAGEPFSTNSASLILADGSADPTTVTFDFTANTPADFEDGVQNVQFRISDIDGLNNGTTYFQDIVTVTAFDANGNEVSVNITGGSNHTVIDNTITAGLTNYSPTSAEASALIEIPGPVSQIVVSYDNGGTSPQAIYFSDIHFDAVPVGSDDDVINAGDGNDTIYAGYGNDTVSAGTGNDIIYGEAGSDTLNGDAGNDTIYLGDGDSADGGDGDDTFILDPTLLDGGSLNIVGGEGVETAGDTLDFNGQLDLGSIVYSNTDDSAGGLSGTATLLDGTTVVFSEIETIICFTTGALIETPYGARRVETLRPGDLVLTHDNGPQPIRWTGSRTVCGTGKLAPIEFAAGSIGDNQAFQVSPQHRVLIDDYRAQLYFGGDEILAAASFLINNRTIIQRETAMVTYHHILFDDHEIVQSSGIWTESFQPGSYSLPGLDPKAREELFAVFPELRLNPIAYGRSARPSISRQNARLLAA